MSRRGNGACIRATSVGSGVAPFAMGLALGCQPPVSLLLKVAFAIIAIKLGVQHIMDSLGAAHLVCDNYVCLAERSHHFTSLSRYAATESVMVMVTLTLALAAPGVLLYPSLLYARRLANLRNRDRRVCVPLQAEQGNRIYELSHATSWSAALVNALHSAVVHLRSLRLYSAICSLALCVTLNVLKMGARIFNFEPSLDLTWPPCPLTRRGILSSASPSSGSLRVRTSNHDREPRDVSACLRCGRSIPQYCLLHGN
eukprot:6214105-Pleurochrysis_carterae.AAC.1